MSDDPKWFAWILIGVGILVAIASVTYATNESRRRLNAWAHEEISRDEDLSAWPPRAARIARLVAAQEILEQGRAPEWTQVSPWPGVTTGGAIIGLGVIVLAIRSRQ